MLKNLMCSLIIQISIIFGNSTLPAEKTSGLPGHKPFYQKPANNLWTDNMPVELMHELGMAKVLIPKRLNGLLL